MTQKSSSLEPNPSIEYSVHYHPNCIAELSVIVPTELSVEARHLACRLIGKEKILPGFRKGKAPENLIEKNYSKEVDKAWQEQMAHLSLKECLKTSPVSPLNQDTKVAFHADNPSLDNPSKLSLKFEIEPKLPDVDISDFVLQEVQRPVVNQEKVDETIRQSLFFFAEWENVTDRAVQENDCVVLDVDVIETQPTKPLFKATRFEVTNRGMAKWMKEMVIGMRAGETKEGMSVADEEASEEEKAIFKPKKVRLTLKSIQKATLPELTDEFCKNLGVQSIPELNQNIENILNRQADEHVKEKEREQISAFLLQKYPFDLPLSLIEREVRFRAEQLFRDPDFQSYWHTLSEEERKKSIDALFEQSKKAIRMFYLCRKLIATHKISVQPSEMKQAALSPLEVLINPTLHLQGQGTDIENAEAFSRLILEKAEDFLIAQAKQGAAK